MPFWFHLCFGGHKYFVEHQNNSSWNSIYTVPIEKFEVSSNNMHPLNTFTLTGGKNSTDSVPLHSAAEP